MSQWSWPNQQVVREDESGPGLDTPPQMESRWRVASSAAVPTVNGHVAFATGDQANPGTIWVTLVDSAGDDQSDRALRLTVGSVLRLESVATNIFQEYVCRDAPTLDGGLLTLVDPIHWDSSGLLADDEEVIITGRTSL